MARPKKRQSTLSPEDWLNGGLELLAKAGPSAMTVAQLARYLGVTRGSFYWHFKTVPQYQEALFNHWHAKLIRVVAGDAKTAASPMEELLRLIASRDLPKYDHAIRSWAKTNPLAAKAIDQSDKFRLARLTEIFNAGGLNLEEARKRAQAIVWLAKGAQDEKNLGWRNEVLLDLFTIAMKA